MTFDLSVLLVTMVVAACIMFWAANRGYQPYTLLWGLGSLCLCLEYGLPRFSITNGGIEILIIVIGLLIAGAVGLIGGFYNYASRENEAWRRYKASHAHSVGYRDLVVEQVCYEARRRYEESHAQGERHD